MGSTKQETTRDLAAVPSGAGPLGFLAWIGQSEHQKAAGAIAAEHPQHRVAIARGFALGLTPVTRGEFAAFVRETGYHTGSCWLWHVGRPTPPVVDGWLRPGFAQSDQDPVVCVTWQDAQAYVRWLNRKLGLGGPDGSGGPYRLPSEAEWEYAARAGTQTAYWWGNEVGTGHAWCDGCDEFKARLTAEHPFVAPPPSLRHDHTVVVGAFPANPFGLYDMPGNVLQWTEDCWNANYAGAPGDGSAWLSGDCGRRVVRGASWHSLPWTARPAARTPNKTDSTWNDIGFRVAKDAR